MKPIFHILLGFLFSSILLLIFPQIGIIEAGLIFFSSVLIDIDHYFYYLYKKKDFSLSKAYKYWIKNREKWRKLKKKDYKKYKINPMPFHGFELLIILLILSLINPIFFWIFLGILLHLTLDLITLKYYKFPLYAKLSQVYVWISNKDKEVLR